MAQRNYRHPVGRGPTAPRVVMVTVIATIAVAATVLTKAWPS